MSETKKLELVDRTKKFEEQLTGAMKENEIGIVLSIDFPQFKILPDEVKLALSVMEKNGYVLKLSYDDGSKVPAEEEKIPAKG